MGIKEPSFNETGMFFKVVMYKKSIGDDLRVSEKVAIKDEKFL